jgi:hypothetical protein
VEEGTSLGEWGGEARNSHSLSVNEGGTRNKGREEGWGDKPTSQRSQSTSKQRHGEAQRVRMRVGQLANLPKQECG